MRTLLPCLFIAIALSSCCVKKECDQVTSVSLYFYGFAPAEVDTIYITGYKPGSNFAQVTSMTRIDSASGTMNEDSTYNYRTRPYGLYDDQDWELTIPAVNKSYRIENYSYTPLTCGCPHDKVNNLTGCTVNGMQTKLPVNIHK